MAGVWATEGKQVAANLVFIHADVNRGTTIQLGLFTNASGLSAASVLSAITEPTGASYSRISLADASWTVTAGLATYAAQTFTASVAITGTIYGYFLATTGTAPKLLAYEINTVAGPIAMNVNDTYTITPSIQVG